MKQNERIVIRKNKDNTFNVYYGEKCADGVNYDEMLGLVTCITMPDARPCLNYLWTKEQLIEWKKKYRNNEQVKE